MPILTNYAKELIELAKIQKVTSVFYDNSRDLFYIGDGYIGLCILNGCTPCEDITLVYQSTASERELYNAFYGYSN